jgi:hypothetical protein
MDFDGIVKKIRDGVGDVGSFLSGQPQQSPQQIKPPQLPIQPQPWHAPMAVPQPQTQPMPQPGQNLNNGITSIGNFALKDIGSAANYIGQTASDAIKAAPSFINDSIVKPVANTVMGDVVYPADQLLAGQQGDRRAYNIAGQMKDEAQANSLPQQMIKGVAQFGNAARNVPGAVGTEVQNAVDPRHAQPNTSAQQGLTALNQSYQGLGLTGPEDIIAHTVPGAYQASKESGFDPDQKVAGVLAKTALGAAADTAPMYGLEHGDPFGAISALDTGKAIASKVADSARAPALAAAEQVSGIPREKVVNENEAGTLRDWADYKTGSYQPSGNDINHLDMQARNAAQTAGINVTSGSPSDITDRIYGYLSLRNQFMKTHDSIMQGGYIGGPQAISFPTEFTQGNTFQGADTLPRFEKADNLAGVRHLPDNQPTSLDKALNHPTLFQDYPQLQGVQVRAANFKNDNINGGYVAKDNTIYINKKITDNPALYKATLLHETQHAIQRVEGFDQGTNSLVSGRAAYNASPGEQEAHAVGDRMRMNQEQLAANPIEIKGGTHLPTQDASDLATSEGGIDRTKLTGRRLDMTNAQLSTPMSIGHALGMSDEEINRASSPRQLPDRPDVTPLESDAAEQTMLKPKLSQEDRQNLINNEEFQQTKNKVTLQVPEGNIKGGIAQTEGIGDERLSRFSKAVQTANKLNNDDKAQLSDALNGEQVTNIKDPVRFNKALDQLRDAYDYSLASDRAAGGTTLRWHGGDYSPLYLNATPKQMDALGVPAENRIAEGKFHGFRDDTRQFKSYKQAAGKGLKKLFADGTEDARHYALGGDTPIRHALLKEAMYQAAPHDIAEAGMGKEENGTPYRQAPGGMPFYTSSKLRSALRGYSEGLQGDGRMSKLAIRGLKGANGLSKAALFLGTPFHYSNLTKNFLGLTTLTGHLGTGIKGMAKGVYSQIPGGYNRLAAAAEKSGTMDWIRQAGVPLHDNVRALKSSGTGLTVRNGLNAFNDKLAQFTNTLAIQLADTAREHGVDPKSSEGVALAQEYGKVLGLINSKISNDPGVLRDVLSAGGLAPTWTRSQLALLKDSATSFKGSKGIGLFNAGDVARGTVLGSRFVEAATGIIGSALATGQMPTFQQLVNQAGFNPSNPVPNIRTNMKNQKGQRQLIDLPTDQLGLGTGLITDPSHFVQSRLSPIGSAGMKLITNQDWNGQPLADRNLPNWPQVTAGKIAQGFLPISVQNHTNPNLTQEQGLIQDIGGRMKTDPDDPQAKGNANYFKQSGSLINALSTGKLSQIDPSLKDITPEQAHQWVQQYGALHPSGTTDPTGQKYPQRYNPLASEQRYASYVDSSSGTPHLSPLFYIDQKLGEATPGYPSSPLYKLSGTGTSASGQQSPQAVVALEYQHEQDPAAKTVLMDANGGQNGWLAKYESTNADYSKNYQQNMTDYFKNLGWSTPTINQYWQNHPSTPDPVAQTSFDKPTTDLINQYYQLTANGDSTAASKFFTANSGVLGDAFNQVAQHSNALRAARGEAELQGYPTEPDHVKQILSSMPGGADSASKKARAQLINGNPDVSQYLANVSLYEALGKGAQFRYINPANPTATEGQNINNGGQAGQTTLKNISSLGKYSIGSVANSDGTTSYNFMQNGGFAPGSTTGASSGSSSNAKREAVNMIKHRPKLRTLRTPRKPLIRRLKEQKQLDKGDAGYKINPRGHFTAVTTTKGIKNIRAKSATRGVGIKSYKVV